MPPDAPSTSVPSVVPSVLPFLVIDDFLPADIHRHIWLYFQVENFARVDVSSPTGQWAWHDGAALRGPTIGYRTKWHAKYPTGTAVDALMENIVRQEERFRPVLGKYDSDWNDFSASPALYPSGTGLSWHRDAENNAGSFVYYVHPAWNVEWGGELLLGDPAQMAIPAGLGPFFNPAPADLNDDGASWLNSHLENERASETLLAAGTGAFVMPKPNRLVVIRGGLPHKIAKVTLVAGAHMRASVTGFFKRTAGKPTR
jgi:Rps23 Pro-64 3,4-dihydroxylase Tpa1-like proline 4-hydroxylase